jgi:hypothetical protein
MSVRFLAMLPFALACCAFAAAPDATQIDTIALERTRCYGTCPVYKITLRRDGTVTYQGKKWVRVIGQRSHKISVDAFQRLAREAERIQFFSFKDEYVWKDNFDGSSEHVTDSPTRITTVRAGRVRKVVKNYYGGPVALEGLEKLIDDVSGSVVWIGE